MTSAFGQTLKSITTTKLNEISKKSKNFEANKSSVLTSLALQRNQHERVDLLLQGLKKCFDIQTVPQKRGRGHDTYSDMVPMSNNHEIVNTLRTISRFLEQARFDPTVSAKLLHDWEDTLMNRLNIQSTKFEYATLYGELVNDWITLEQDPPVDTAMDVDEFEFVDKAEKLAARKQWEKVVFQPLETDTAAIKGYLQKLFGKPETAKGLAELRRSVELFETELARPDQFNEHVLKWSIQGLLGSGLLSDEKNQVLKDFLGSPVILTEVADVLNMRMASIENWHWEQEHVPVEERRHLSGSYHIYIDEDIVEAIFLQYIGTRWSVFFKQAFNNFIKSDGAWASSENMPSKDELHRRKEFLGPQNKKPSVHSRRQGFHKSFFFMSHLPSSVDETSSAAAGEEEADYNNTLTNPTQTKTTAQMQMQMLQQQQQQRQQQQQQQGAAMMMQNAVRQSVQAPGMSTRSMFRQSNNFGYLHGMDNIDNSDEEFDSDNYSDFKPRSPMETKQFLLHLISTEILFNTRFHGEFTAIHSSFDSWSPTLPHSTIRAVFSFYGFSSRWLSFLTTFLEAPLRFASDGDEAPTRKRKRGVPGAHSLSSICGEAVLFILDFVVNQKTKGTSLYRMHDDFWLWSHDHSIVVDGWNAIRDFTSVMGVTLNDGKTGSTRVGLSHNASLTVHPSLPTGTIRWGFLMLDSASGRFIIDQDMVDKHIIDLQSQVKDKRSVFSYIQAWNAYAGTFFLSNFGSPSNSFGRAHVDAILTTLHKVQSSLPNEADIATRIRAMIDEKFGVQDLPDGFLYFPTSLGGLGLQNPFVGMIQVRNSVAREPSALLDKYLEDEKQAYAKAKKDWETGVTSKLNNANKYVMPKFNERPATQFMPFDDFTKYREQIAANWKGNLLSVYEELLRKPDVVPVDTRALDSTSGIVQNMVKGVPELDSDYMKWVGVLHGKEMMKKFGGLRIVEKGLLPTGMVELFRSGRIKWQG